MSTERLLAIIVDDDLLISEAMRTGLARRGVDSVRFADIDRVLAYDGPRPDVIVVDIVIEGERKGFTLLEMLKGHERFRSIPAIVVSDYGARQDVVRALGLGAKEYVVKSENDLSAIVDRIIATAKGGKSPMDAGPPLT